MRHSLLLTVLVWACLLTGCRSSQPPPAAPAVPPAKNVSASNLPEEKPPEVRDFGYIKSLTNKGGAWRITIQYADMLRGEEARKAAVADKAIGPDDDLEDDYYIRETDQTGSFGIGENVVILLVGETEKAVKPISLTKFADAFNGKNETLAHLADAPYWFTLSGDNVGKIEQQYVP
jgi:hypothetical protein